MPIDIVARGHWSHWLLTAVLGPLLLLQGLHVRRITPRLPEPSGERSGVTGSGPTLRLLILGDSAAAGVGAATQEEALSGQLMLNLTKDYRLHWKLHAGSGWSTTDLLRDYPAADREPYDVIVLSLGVNDVTGNCPAEAWLRLQETLSEQLLAAHSPRRVLWTGVPPMQQFPALPQPLRWYLGRNAARMNRLLEAWIRTQPGATYVAPFTGGQESGYMARDGFHPGPRAYAAWAQHLAEIIRAGL